MNQFCSYIIMYYYIIFSLFLHFGTNKIQSKYDLDSYVISRV